MTLDETDDKREQKQLATCLKVTCFFLDFFCAEIVPCLLALFFSAASLTFVVAAVVHAECTGVTRGQEAAVCSPGDPD